MSPPLVELQALILTVANGPGGQVRLWSLARGLPDGEALSANIAWERVEPATLAHQLVAALEDRGPIPADLLQALAEERPSLLPRLCALALTLGLPPPREPPGQRPRLSPLAAALTDRLGADPHPVLALLPGAPAAQTWLDVLLDADTATRGALLALCWPRAATPTRAELRQHLACLIGASTLTCSELLALTQHASVAIGVPLAERLDAFLAELLLPQRTDQRLLALAIHTAAALSPEEASAFAIAEFVQRVVEEQESREVELERALHLAARALLAKLWAARRRQAPVEPTLDEALGLPPVAAEDLDGDARLDHERDLDEAETLTDALRFRVSPWSWLRATALVQRASRGGLDPEQRARATELQARLRPRLRWLVAGGGVSAWLTLTLLSAAFPLYVWSLASLPPLAWLLLWLRLVAVSGAVAASVVAGGMALLPEELPQEGEPGHDDKRVQDRAGYIILEILGDPQPGAWDISQQPARRVEAIRLDEQKRVVVPEAPEPVMSEPRADEVPPPPTTPAPDDEAREPAGDPLSDDVGDEGTGDDQEGDAAKSGEAPPEGGTGTAGETPTDEEPGTAPPGPDLTPAPSGTTGKHWITTATPDAPMTFVGLSGGRFRMGAPEGEAGSDDSERPQHLVRVSDFAVGQTEVTQAQWAAVVAAAQAAGDADAAGMKVDPSRFKGAKRPVEQVSWCDAARFANALSRLEGKRSAYTVGSDCEDQGEVTWDRAADGYRLPTEAEWEYAARAGTITAYATGDTEADLARAGWYEGNSGGETHDVCTAEVKPWTLCDLHGNVWEWTWDWYGAYQNAEAGNPAGPARGDLRVLRGGSWDYTPDYARSANRGNWLPSGSSLRAVFGFLLVLPVPASEP